MFYRIEERLRNIDERTQGLDNENKLIAPQEADISLDSNWLKSILPPSKVGQVTQLIQRITQLDIPETATKMADFWLSFSKISQHQHVRQVPVIETGTTTGVLTTLGGTYLVKDAKKQRDQSAADVSTFDRTRHVWRQIVCPYPFDVRFSQRLVCANPTGFERCSY